MFHFHFIKHNSAVAINYVALVWKRRGKGHTRQAGSGVEGSTAPCDSRSLTVWVRAVPQRLSVPVASVFVGLLQDMRWGWSWKSSIWKHRGFLMYKLKSNVCAAHSTKFKSLTDVKIWYLFSICRRFISYMLLFSGPRPRYCWLLCEIAVAFVSVEVMKFIRFVILLLLHNLPIT